MLLALPAARAQDTKEHSYIGTQDGKKVFDDEFMKIVKKELDNAYQNLQIVVASCYAGGFADEGALTLQGNWSVNTCRDKDHCVTTEATNQEMQSGEAGLELGAWWYHGWKPQWIKKLTADGNTATAQTLANYARDHDHLTGGNPQFKFGGTGNNATIRDGTQSNHALIWAAKPSDAFGKPLMTGLYSALVAAGYDNATIDYAYNSKGGQNVEAKPVDRDATKANLETMLTSLRTNLNAHPGNEKAFIWLDAHGNTEKRKAEKQTGALPGTPFQGKQIVNAGTTSLELTPAFTARLLEEVTLDDPDWDRTGSASLHISTTEETFAGPVEVRIDGLPAGTIQLGGGTFGADYELTLSDSVLAALETSGAFDDESLNVQFLFDEQTGTEAFRIATEWDFDSPDFTLSHYGVGLAAGDAVSEFIPEPAAFALMVAAVLVFRRR